MEDMNDFIPTYHMHLLQSQTTKILLVLFSSVKVGKIKVGSNTNNVFSTFQPSFVKANLRLGYF